MRDVLFVAVIYGLHYLHKDSRCVLFVEVLFFHNLVEQLATFAQLRDQVYILLVFEILVELEDVGVVQRSEDLYLLLESLLVLYLFASNYLACSFLAGFNVLYFPDHAESTRTQGLLVHLVYLRDRLRVQSDHLRFFNYEGVEWVLGLLRRWLFRFHWF